MTKTGLVFSGGGGKGAYAIGVWKALREYGLDANISAVAGTSVGGLNGALFVQGDLEKAEQLWLDIATDKILQLDIKVLAEKIAKIAASFSVPGFQAKALYQLAEILKGKGWFSQNGLQTLIEQSGACTTIPNSSMPFYVCALGQKTGQLSLPLLNELPEEEIVQWLLASAAIPGVFNAIEINGSNYWDGGVLPGRFSNNTPFQPLIEQEKCTHIINIYLSRDPEVTQPQNDYPNVKFWNIIPSEKFDGAIPPLNFTADNAKKLIELGYNDVSKMLKQFKAFMDDEERFLDAVCDFQQSHEQFSEQVQLNQSLRFQPDSANSNDAGKDVAPVNYKDVMDQLAVTINQQEQTLINNGLDTLIEDMKDNSEQLLEEAFTAITTLATNEGRINSQIEQSGFSRLLGTITGSNFKQQAEINQTVHNSLYATQQLIQKLNHKQALTMEAMVSLSNKSSYLMSHINMLYGAVQSQEQRQVESFKLFTQGINALAQETEQKFSQLNQRIERIEHKQSLEDWFHDIRNNLLQQAPLEKLLHATASFYEASGRSWEQPELNRYKSALKDIGLTNQTFAPAQLFEHQNARVLVEQIQADSILPVAPEKEYFHTLLKGVQISVESEATQNTEQLQALLPTPVQTEIPAVQLGLELLYSLRRNDRRKPAISGAQSLSGNQTGLQNQYLSALSQARTLADQIPLSQPCKENIDYLIEQVKNFKVVVPVIGKFSAGKSALLNRYLGSEHLASDITPETAIATEIAYNEHEHIILNYQDGTKKQLPLSALQTLGENDQLAFVQVYLNNVRLKHRPNLVLVDMPGFDSRNQSHHKAIAWYLSRGDHFICLMPSDVPFDASVMEHLAEIQYDYSKEITCLISKSARRSPAQLVELQRQLSESINDYLQIDMQPAAIEAKDSNGTIQPFENELDNAVRNFDALLADRYRTDILKAIKLAEQQVKAGLQNLNGGEAEIEENIRQAKEAFQGIQQKLDNDLNELKYNLCSLGKEQLFAEASNTLTTATDQLVRAAKNNTLSEEINTLIRPVMQVSLHELIDHEMAQLQEKIENLPQTESQITVAIQLPPEEKESFSTTYAAIAAGLSILFTGPLGATIAGVLGGLFGRKDNADERENQIRQSVTQQVIPETSRQVAQHIEIKLQEAVSKLSTGVQNILAKERSSYEENLQQLKACLQKAQTSMQEQQAQYGEWVDELTTLHKAISAT